MTLPKFLLAWSDFNWLWIFAKLRPAKDARWSITRVVLLTAMKAAGGASVGLVLSLLIFRQPVGWLPWLLGLFAGCAGLCWFGVTAICWNQRAAQLRANPALPTALPKARYHFFRCCLGFVYLVVLGVITPFALFITIENVRGEIAWKRERAKLEAQGEKLTFRKILGPAIPADQNAGTAPVFAPLFDYQHNIPTRVQSVDGEVYYASGLVWPQSNQLAQLENEFRTPADYLPNTTKGSRKALNTPQINMADWSAAYRSSIAKPKGYDVAWVNDLKLPPPGDPTRDVLAALSRADKDLAEICAAAALPRSQFPLHYDEAFDCLLRHLSLLKGVQQTLQLRCAAHLAVGETNAAFADVTNALNVAELLREEPFLISQLVRYAQGNIAISTLWQGLAEHRWSDAELVAFQQRLGRVDYLPGIVLAFEGERAGGVLGMEQLIGNGRVLQGGGPVVPRALQPVARGMLRQNQAALAHFETAHLAGLRNGRSDALQSGLTAIMDSDEAKLEKLIPTTYSPFTVMVTMLAPATGRAAEKTVRAQTLMKLAEAACALERYHLAHGEFPEKLEQLSPQFIATVPLDPMVNQPFHYRRTDDGWFLLYSVGLNGTDDGGEMKSDDKKDKDDKDWPWPVPTRPTHPRLF